MVMLGDFEGLATSALHRGGSQWVEVCAPSGTAQTRLRQIVRDDVDQLTLFRISGQQRVWCIASNMVMKIP